jgi:hypothetical protein
VVPSHGRCASPLAITTPSTREERGIDAVDYPPSCDLPDGRALFYRVNVPVGQRVNVTVSPVQPTSPQRLRFLTGCAPDACAMRTVLSQRDSVQWTNGGTSPANILVALEALYLYRPTAVSFTTTPVSPDAVCTTAPLLDATPQPASVERGGAIAPTCDLNGTSAPTLFYAVDVPPGRTVTGTYLGAAGPLPGLRFLAGCAPSVCLSAWVNATTGLENGVVASWRNTGATTRRVLLGVSFSPDAAQLNPGSVRVELSP